MPRISYFYGITINMYWREDRHSTPHFHAYYGEHEASLNLTGEIIAGFLPKRALRLVQDWAGLRAGELNADWERVVNKELPEPIAPLL
jgi:hypothetical protein